MVSGSDRHASEWRHGFRVPGADGLDLDHAYKAMAWLGEAIEHGRGTADAIEEALYRHRQPLFGEVSIAFFDTTTLWFEGAGGESLGQRGHSKDYRAHLKQVVLGIVLDGDDRPIASFLMPGNTADVTMLLPVVRRLRERFGIARACIVADRGMISAATIAALEAEKIEYILGVRERSIREVRDEVIDDDGVAVPLVIPRQKGETQLAIKETTIAGRRYVLCRNEEEAKKDAEARAELLAGLERKLAQGDKALVANKGFRRFLEDARGRRLHHRSRPRSRRTPVSTACSCCAPTPGSSALQVVLRYRNLLAVEDAFKTAKALLATRPIFHKTDAAIRGHVFCTFLALVLRKELIDRLAARRSKRSNGSASSTISPTSARSRSSRTAAGRCCEPLPARPSTRSAAPSASPCRPSSRRCRPPAEPPPKLWCLNLKMASKPLIMQPSSNPNCGSWVKVMSRKYELLPWRKRMIGASGQNTIEVILETSRHCRVQHGGHSTYYNKSYGTQENLPSQLARNLTIDQYCQR